MMYGLKDTEILAENVLWSDVMLFVCRSVSAVPRPSTPVVVRGVGKRLKQSCCALSDFLTVWVVGLAGIFSSY